MVHEKIDWKTTKGDSNLRPGLGTSEDPTERAARIAGRTAVRLGGIKAATQMHREVRTRRSRVAGEEGGPRGQGRRWI